MILTRGCREKCETTDVKWIWVAVVVPILSLTLAPTLAGSQVADSIRSPGGNIICQAFGSSKVICTTTKPFRSAALVSGRRAHRVTPLRLRPGRTLVYGDAWGGATQLPLKLFQCASELRAMVCTDFGMHGFAIGRARVDTW